ncbi:hypothetical protein FISHEDRAFT_58672 [Fistulina hepatica ATCC 64428]|uniref:REJ domain-containing protein n=1 Tax=Fistulina hepatica ATCC 64428 TaxID=1128425 RepID=A0A0D7AG08_9AGAR|nr:hypothetical protein FISHEDRAFT_58672 [Fistulina hepatica ATCC 64428]
MSNSTSNFPDVSSTTSSTVSSDGDPTASTTSLASGTSSVTSSDASVTDTSTVTSQTATSTSQALTFATSSSVSESASISQALSSGASNSISSSSSSNVSSTTSLSSSSSSEFSARTFPSFTEATSTATAQSTASNGQTVEVTTIISYTTTADVAGSSTNGTSTSGHSSSDTGAIVGGVVGGIAGLALLFAALFFAWRKWGRGRHSEFDGNFDPVRVMRTDTGGTLPNIELDDDGPPGAPTLTPYPVMYDPRTSPRGMVVNGVSYDPSKSSSPPPQSQSPPPMSQYSASSFYGSSGHPTMMDTYGVGVAASEHGGARTGNENHVSAGSEYHADGSEGSSVPPSGGARGASVKERETYRGGFGFADANTPFVIANPDPGFVPYPAGPGGYSSGGQISPVRAAQMPGSISPEMRETYLASGPESMRGTSSPEVSPSSMTYPVSSEPDYQPLQVFVHEDGGRAEIPPTSTILILTRYRDEPIDFLHSLAYRRFTIHGVAALRPTEGPRRCLFAVVVFQVHMAVRTEGRMSHEVHEFEGGEVQRLANGADYILDEQ